MDGLINLRNNRNNMVKNKSPLRYPGGKTRAIQILKSYVDKYFPNTSVLVSPFLGGGSFEIYMQDNGYTVYGNDLFQPLYIFWKISKTRNRELIEKVRSKMPVTKEAFLSMRSLINQTTDELEIAAMYYIINRCSFSGSTFCGGFSKQASTDRLNESSLETLKRLDISNIHLSNRDCCEFLKQCDESESMIVYADPPYYITNYIYGKNGDLHESFDHKSFADEIQKRRNWIVSYNDCEYVRSLYDGCQFFTEEWSYGMNSSKKSNEVIILPPIE